MSGYSRLKRIGSIIALATFVVGSAAALGAAAALHAHSRQSGQAADAESLAVEFSKLQRNYAFARRILTASRLTSDVFILEDSLRVTNDGKIRFAALQYPVVLYTVDYECPYCRANIPFLNTIEEARPCDARVIGLHVGGNPTPPTHDSSVARFPIIESASGSAWDALPIRDVVPVAIAIGSDGRILDWWVGVLTHDDQRLLSNRLRVECHNR